MSIPESPASRTPEFRCRSVHVAIPAEDVDHIAGQVAVFLGVTFEKHRSDYWGDYCLLHSAELTKIRIYKNKDPMHDPVNDPSEERFFEPDFSGFPILLDASSRIDFSDSLVQQLLRAIPGSVLIRATAAD